MDIKSVQILDVIRDSLKNLFLLKYVHQILRQIVVDIEALVNICELVAFYYREIVIIWV